MISLGLPFHQEKAGDREWAFLDKQLRKVNCRKPADRPENLFLKLRKTRGVSD
jgi:hypothetical protein